MEHDAKERIPWSAWVGRALKGVGAALAVLSLISGLRSLGSLWLEHRDEAAATRSSLTAARLMAEGDLFAAAWAELDRAAAAVGEPELLPERADVAMQWVRWMGGQPMGQVDYRETAERLLPYLYRALAEPGDFNPADLRAHIAWATYLGGLMDSTTVDPEQVLTQALAEDPDNVYARTVLGFLESQRGYESFDAVADNFDAATSGGDEDWAERLQLSALAAVFEDQLRRARSDGTLMEIARRALPLAARHPRHEAFDSVLASWLYDLEDSENAGLLEDLVPLLEPDDWLKVLDAAYRDRGVTPACRYLEARLEETRGNLDAARAHLEALHGLGVLAVHPSFLALLQAAESRLGLTATAAAPASNATPSEVPADGEPWRAHATTLMTFDPDFTADELWAAVTYFDELPADELSPEMRAAVVQSRNRVKDYVDEGERWLLETGGSEDTEADLAVPRDNLALLWYLVGRMAEKSGDLDAAITEWTDLYPRLTGIVTLDWELAVAHAARVGTPGAGAAGDQRDRERAVDYLQRYVEHLRTASEPIPWQQISEEPAFASLSDNAGFQALMRGRR